MAFNKDQFQSLITEVLKEAKLYSESAVYLLLGTAAQESEFGTQLRQLGGGPARGAFQMEGATFDDLQKRFGPTFKQIQQYKLSDLEHNLKAAILMCRIKYFSIRQPLPKADDLPGLAMYWKKYYNTMLGKGTIEEFIKHYHKYIG